MLVSAVRGSVCCQPSHESHILTCHVIQQEKITSSQAQSGGATPARHREHDSSRPQLFRTATNTDHGAARGQLHGDDDADQGSDVPGKPAETVAAAHPTESGQTRGSPESEHQPPVTAVPGDQLRLAIPHLLLVLHVTILDVTTNIIG